MKTTLLLALLIGIGVGIVINQESFKSASAEVYHQCQLARMDNSVAESRCAELQDKYKIEFLCESRNNSPSNYCWTEENKGLGN